MTTSNAHVNLCVIQPAGYVHSLGLLDAANYFAYQFRRLGARVDVQMNQLVDGAVNFVFGAHLGFDAALTRRFTCIIVNLEQIGSQGARLPAAYLDLLRNSAVIDYDAAHPQEYGAKPGEVPLVSFGHAPYLPRAACSPSDLAARPIDLLFFGSTNERRRRLFQRIEAGGRRIHVAPMPLYGAPRDALIAQSKAVLNLHFYDSARFEQVRGFQVLSMGTPLVSERTAATQPPHAFDLCTLWFDDASMESFFRDEFLSPLYYEVAARSLDVFVDADPQDEYAAALEFALGVQKVQRAPAAPLCSIVIPVFNKVEFTSQCVLGLRGATPDSLYELIFIDNASTDDTAPYLAGLTGRVKVISNTENLGFVDACNQGAAAARGRYIVFLNNDTLPLNGWLEALVETLESDPGVGAAGARLVYPDGRLQEAGGLVFNDGSGWNFGRFGDPAHAAFATACEVDYCSGAALMVRRDLFERLGGFDRRFAPAYYEDTDLCFALRSIGHKVMYCPTSTVVHFEGITAGTDVTSGFKRFQVINKEKFVAKWALALQAQDAPPSVSGRQPTTADRRRLGAAATPRRDRPPHVLIVDPFLPMHDRASGSLRLFRIVQALRELEYDVTFIARNGIGQDVYRRQLESMGVVVHATDPDKLAQLGCASDAPRIDLARLLAHHPCDVAWLSFYDVAEQYLPDIRALSPRTTVVIDTVDVHFLRERRQAQLAGDGAALGRAEVTRERELKIYGLADRVVTVTDADAQVLRDAGLQVPTSTVPNIHPAVGATPGWDTRAGLLFVGNFNHTPNVDAATWLVRDIMPRIVKALPTVVLEIVGTNPPDAVRALAGSNVVVRGWVPDTAPHLDAARVSVAPLRVGAGMKGKVGEALAHGLPVVSTTIGAEGMQLEDGRHVLIADDAEHFAAAVVRLYQDRTLWQALAAAGRAQVEGAYSPAAVAQTLASIVRSARARQVAPVAAATGNAQRAVKRPGTWLVLAPEHEDAVTASFANAIAGGLREAGLAARAAAASRQFARQLGGMRADELAGVIAIGSLPLALTIGGRPLHRALACPVYAYLLDSPIYDLARVPATRQFIADAWSEDRLVPMVAEKSYFDLMRSGPDPLLPPQSRYLPFAAFPADDATEAKVKRQDRLLVVGTLGNELYGWAVRRELLQTLRDSNAPGLADVDLIRLAERLSAPDARGNVVAHLLQSLGMTGDAMGDHAVQQLACAADSHMKRERRRAAIESLRKAPVDFIGSGWQEAFGSVKSFRFLGRIDHPDIARLMPLYRGIVNFDPNWEWGQHDRVYTAVASGVPVLTHANGGIADEGLPAELVIPFRPNAPMLAAPAERLCSGRPATFAPVDRMRLGWGERVRRLLGLPAPAAADHRALEAA